MARTPRARKWAAHVNQLQLLDVVTTSGTVPSMRSEQLMLASMPVASPATVPKRRRRSPSLRAVVHDQDGPWFGVGGLWLSFLDKEQLKELRAGNEHVLVGRAAQNLLDLLPGAFEADDIEWG